VVEREFGLVWGFWGAIAAGGRFPRATEVVGGRQRPHAKDRSRAVLKHAAVSLTQAEVLVNRMVDVTRVGREHDRAYKTRVFSDRWAPANIAAEDIVRAADELRRSASRWSQLRAEEHLLATWDLAVPRLPSIGGHRAVR
jgi:hypothetical protein